MYTIVRLPVCDPRLPHDRQAVGDGLDAGVRAAAERVGADEEQQQPADAERRQPVVEARARRRATVAGSSGRWPRMPPHDE